MQPEVNLSDGSTQSACQRSRCGQTRQRPKKRSHSRRGADKVKEGHLSFTLSVSLARADSDARAHLAELLVIYREVNLNCAACPARSVCTHLTVTSGVGNAGTQDVHID